MLQVYVDLDPPDWTLNPEKLKKAFTERTKAVVLNRLELNIPQLINIFLIMVY